MTVVELKEKLIAQINSIDDEELLDSLSRTVELELEINKGTYIMSADEIEAVKDGLEQLKNGQWISHEEASREIDEWLKK
jgi:predicted transcriptional regulator